MSGTALPRCLPRWRWPPAGSPTPASPRHRHSEFLAFLKLVAKAYPRRQLHVVVDNYATHKHERVQAWLGKHPRVQLHFTPTHAFWLNLVEVFFSIIERQALRRGDFASIQELVTAIRRFCDSWNQRRQPFTWARDADQILAKLNRPLRKGCASMSLTVPGRSGVLGDGHGGWSMAGGRVPPQLEQVVGAAQQLPLRVAGAPAAAQEPPGTLVFLDLAEHRLHGLPAFGVAGLAVLAGELGFYRRAEPVAADADGLPSLRGLPWRPCLAGGI
jgi:transposase